MTDRLSDGYQPDWDIDLAVGKQGEMFVHDIVKAIADGGSIEVKTDEAAAKFGNVYLESHCRRRGGWQPSGLKATQAELWATVLAGQVLVVAPTWLFRQVANQAYRTRPSARKEMPRGSHPTRGVVVPVDRLLRLLMDATSPGLKESA